MIMRKTTATKFIIMKAHVTQCNCEAHLSFVLFCFVLPGEQYKFMTQKNIIS